MSNTNLLVLQIDSDDYTILRIDHDNGPNVEVTMTDGSQWQLLESEESAELVVNEYLMNMAVNDSAEFIALHGPNNIMGLLLNPHISFDDFIKSSVNDCLAGYFGSYNDLTSYVDVPHDSDSEVANLEAIKESLGFNPTFAIMTTPQEEN